MTLSFPRLPLLARSIVPPFLATSALLVGAGPATAADGATGGALGWLGSAAEEVSANVLGSIAGVLRSLGELALVLALGGLLTFYVLRDGGRGWAWLGCNGEDPGLIRAFPCEHVTVKRTGWGFGMSRGEVSISSTSTR